MSEENKAITLQQAKTLYDDLRQRQENIPSAENIVMVQDQQPTVPANKVWLTETPPAGVEVPTYQEFTGVIAPDYADLDFPVSAGEHCIHNGVLYTAKQNINSSETWTAAHWEAGSVSSKLTEISNDIQGIGTEMKNSEEEGIDLDIADEDGYVLLRLKDGHVETKEFNSKNVSTEVMGTIPRKAGSTESGIDLDIADRQGYVILRLKDGHIITKNFSSDILENIFVANSEDVGKIIKVKTVENGKVTEFELSEASGTNDDIILNIPAKLYATEGIEYNIYFENICEKSDKYEWDVTCSKGRQLERGYRITPSASDAGEYTLKIKATRIDDPSIYKEVTTTLVISEESAGTGDTVKVIVLGDSTTNYGAAVTKLHTDIDGTGMTLKTLGTRGTAPNNHEGRDGWSFQYYFRPADLSDPTITNPFYNPSTQTFDAGYYFTNTGIDIPDWFIINLGINDMFGSENDTQAKAKILETFGYANAMIESILSVSQNIKVGVCLTIPPNHSQDAFGKAYGCSQTRNRYKRNNTMYVNSVIDEYGNKESERIYLIPINTCLDTVYNMTLETMNVNARNTTITYQSPTGNAGVHPNEYGFWQIADVYAAFIKGNV